MIDNILLALHSLAAWEPILAMTAGTLIGIVVGALPGLTATMGVALLIPFTYNMDVLPALGLLAGVHNGASYGGAIPAILLRIPGTPGAIVTAFDGYPMRQKGLAGPALRLCAMSSAVGGMLSSIALISLAPPLAEITLAFGPVEIFWVNIFGLTSIVLLLGNDILKGLISTAFGLLIGTVGLDIVTGHERFTFGYPELSSGFSLLIFMVGMYSLPPIWEMAEKSDHKGLSSAELVFSAPGKLWSYSRMAVVWLRSSLINIIIGILPGAGGVGPFIAYNEARRASPDPDSFGKGNPEGVAAAESANNADNAAAMIPALTLGLPGSGIAALMLGALLIQGIQPGSQLFLNSPEIVYGYTLEMFFTSVVLLFVGGQVATRVFAQVLRVPQTLLMPMILCLVFAGTYSYQNSMIDIYQVLAFGVIGLFMERTGFPIAPAVIGLILGVKAEYNLRLSMIISGGDWTAIFDSTISKIVIVLILVVAAYPLYQHLRKAERPGGRKGR